MLRVGLTGGTGAGKSTVAGRLAEHGAVVVDADALAREVVAPGTEGLAAVAGEFGDQVLAADGSLDRAALAAVVFADPGRRQALERITHPRIAARTGQIIAAAPADAIIVHDVPLLVEKAMGPAYHLVLVVDAPVEERVDRLAVRGMAADDARARIAAQATQEQRRAAADVWLDNSGGIDRLRERVDELWAERLVPFEHNVRTRTAVRRPDALAIVPPDPTWPVQAQRLAARVALAAGELGLGVEHVGSTAVPGLAAKDVIDLQLGVGSMADADAVCDRLAEAGFPLAVADASDEALAVVDADPAAWAKRLHGGADPERLVHLHVRVHGGPGWRTALLLRDWLRADEAERTAYEQEKRRIAATGATATRYAEEKQPWWGAAVPRALEWARRG